MNILKTDRLKEELRSFLTGEEIRKLGDPFLVLVHTNDRVFFSLENGRELSAPLRELSSDSLKELRAFNKSGELRLWKWNNDIRWRLRIDNPGETANTYEEEQILWGDKIYEESSEETFLKESGRGFSFRTPSFAKIPSLPLKMLVRNYFDFEKDGLLHFRDARLVSLKDQDGREIEWQK